MNRKIVRGKRQSEIKIDEEVNKQLRMKLKERYGKKHVNINITRKRGKLGD